ncbi:hypothetical protein G3580_18295 [Nitrogeniibacter mangrovi]|uniref:Uncharacterized protein n=1 Tax=Nitrogeniibacter mangrovi TaxID=2016596 RepID=A0A6C1BAU2_9RHOO|nr:GspMb/PilO family protein [Nitrogeniibacter mangrovi]QID19394.1 hypothetical protein G3580_18295 [Nitrogeniibacter mangrovi]
MKHLPPALRKLVAVSVLALLAISMASAAGALMARYRTAAVSLEDARFALAQAQNRVRALTSNDEASLSEGWNKVSESLMWEGTASDGEAVLGNLIARLIQAHGVTLNTLRMVASDQPHHLAKASAELSGQGSEVRVLRFLESLEGSSSAIRIERMNIRTVAAGNIPDSREGATLSFDLKVDALGKAPLAGSAQ